MINVAIIIVSYNSNSLTDECLESLKSLVVDENLYSFCVYVVDNSDEEYKNIRKYPFDLEIIRSKVNLGFSGGNNLGIKRAINNGAEYVMLLNNDTRVDKNLLRFLLKEAQDEVVITTPKIYFEKGFEYHKTRYKKDELGRVIWYAGGVMDWKNMIGSHRGVDEVDKGQYDEKKTTDFATGCCMLIKSSIFKKIGMLDELYFLYYEDSDFCMRARKIGKIVFVPNALIWHKNAGSTGGSGSALHDYFITRNRLLFGLKYAPLFVKLALFKEAVSILGKGRKWQKKGVRDFFLYRFGKGSYEGVA